MVRCFTSLYDEKLFVPTWPQSSSSFVRSNRPFKTASGVLVHNSCLHICHGQKKLVLSILVGHPPHTTPTMRIFQLHNCKILTKKWSFITRPLGWHTPSPTDRWHPVVGLINGYLDEGLVVPQPRLELTLRSLLPWNWRFTASKPRRLSFRISEERICRLYLSELGPKLGEN